MIAIPNALASFARARPRHAALIADDRVWTAEAWADEVAAAAGYLAARGVEAGERVGIPAASSSVFARAWQALWWVGAVPVIGSGRPGEAVSDHRTLAPEDIGRGCPVPPADMLLEAPCLSLQTSGSAGWPKTITLTTTQLLFAVFGSTVRLGHYVEDRWLCCLPLHHIGGLSVLWRAMVLQITAVLHPVFDPARVDRSLREGEATLVSLVPDMLRRVLALSGGRPFPPSVRAILVGGERCPAEVVAAARAIAAPVALTWGMTETASQLATRFPGDTAARDDVGPLLPFVGLTSTDEGTLRVTGPMAPGGSLVTADRGRITPKGGVVVGERADDVFISGGENISPSAIERVLRGHPSVVEATVVPLPDGRWGSRPAAWVTVGSSDTVLDGQELRRFCGGLLKSFEVPERVLVTPPDDLPRTATGKADRNAIVRRLGGTVGLTDSTHRQGRETP